MMAISRLDTLIQRFRNKTISNAEHAELLHLLAQPEHARTARKFFKEVMDSQSGDERYFSEAESQGLYASVQAAIQPKKKKPVLRMRPVYKWAGIAAAACVLIIAGYWLMQPPAHKEVKAVVQTKPGAPDLLPGRKNKAVLILADNKQIVLDSTGAGVLSLQGNARIRKDDSGQIIYENGNLVGRPAGPVYNELYIPNGGEYQLVLADGSKVWLNSASRLRFPVNFSGNTREVELSGEAYFEIAKDRSKPFKVHFSDNATVEVLGTHFNVNAYADESKQAVTLLEGSVKVFNPGEEVRIVPGQQAVLAGPDKIKVRHVSTEEAVAWKNGYFMFEDEDIKSIMRKLARWYNFTPVYQGNVDGQNFVAAISRFRNISQVLKMFEATGTIHFKIIPGDNSGKGKKVIVTP
jgi:ferric-dicitrate binding protein FerR (iron transport regulator)